MPFGLQTKSLIVGIVLGAVVLPRVMAIATGASSKA